MRRPSARSRLGAFFNHVVRAIGTAAGAYGRHHGAQLAAAVSYHVLFSLVPLFTFLATVAVLLLQDDERRQDLIEYLVDRFPLSAQAGVDLERTLTQLSTPASALGVLSIVTLLWSASGMMAAIRVGLTAAFESDPPRPFFRSKLVDVVLVLATAAALVLSFAFSIAAQAVTRWGVDLPGELTSVLVEVAGGVVSVAIAFVAFAALYHLVPPSRPPVRSVLFGAFVAALAFELVKVGFSFYLATIATWDVLYGALGSVLAFLLVVYLQATVFLLGGELAAAWPASAEAPSEPGKPFLEQVRGAVRGLFVRDG